MTKKNVMSWIAAAFALAGAASGCGAKSVDIGDDTPPAVLGASLSDYQGTWVGYVELAEWNDGTQTVRLELDDNGNGVIEFGEADPLPAPVADEGFPPGQPTHPMLGIEPVTGVVSGFSYPIEGALVESKRIRLESASNELYREWCELQTSMEDAISFTGYSCLGTPLYWSNEDGVCQLDDGDGDGNGIPIECGRLACVMACECAEDGCSIYDIGQNIRMDAALESQGEELEGSFEVPQGRYFVRMMREE